MQSRSVSVHGKSVKLLTAILCTHQISYKSKLGSEEKDQCIVKYTNKTLK